MGKVGKYGVVKNVSLGKNSTIRGIAFIGGIAGYNDGLIYNCSSQADVSAKLGYVGGIIGYDGKNGRICNCKLSVSAKVTCDYDSFKPCNSLIGRTLELWKNAKSFVTSIPSLVTKMVGP